MAREREQNVQYQYINKMLKLSYKKHPTTRHHIHCYNNLKKHITNIALRNDEPL